jgi:hypothetical protein
MREKQFFSRELNRQDAERSCWEIILPANFGRERQEEKGKKKKGNRGVNLQGQGFIGGLLVPMDALM